MEDKWADYKKKKKKFDEESGYGQGSQVAFERGVRAEESDEEKKKKERFKGLKSLFGS